MEGESRRIEKPERIATYFHLEKWTLAVITVTGIFYNVGMTAGPWFEGQLAQRLCDIILGKKVFADMVGLALLYVAVILVVQTMRYMKRLFVRRFANHINRDMKQVLYRSLVHKKKEELEKESAGAMMTRAISDVDVCVEGMRKFTTEIFDTGVVMAAYLVMLFIYDWRLTLLSMCFPPAAYFIAEKLKKTVSRCAAAGKESAGRLNEATLDRVENALTYRVYGQDENRNADYEICLADYEKKSSECEYLGKRHAAFVSDHIHDGSCFYSVVWRQKCAGQRLDRLGHRGIYHISFLLYQAGCQILQGGQAV